tara:strand:- start:2161 stop:2685 length:525 start_codon:yes stop_codon:yes gene_type:complete
MAIKKILTIPNPILREKSSPVKEVNSEIKDILKDMLETMYNAPGIGLAAIQIGVPKRLVVMDISKEPEKKTPMFFVNPEIISKSEELSTYEEGCLSIPNQFAKIQRSNFCKVKFLDFNGEKKEIKAEGLLSTCIQHEVDHLNGILFIDYLSKLRKDMIVKKASKQKKDQERIVV